MESIVYPGIGELARKAQIPLSEATDLHRLCCSKLLNIGSRIIPASEAPRFNTVTTGDAILDATLGGGFPCGILTEVYGASSTGKTQLACQLCLTAQLPEELGGLDTPVIYVGSEHALPTERLATMAEILEEKVSCCRGFPFMDRILVTGISDLEDQNRLLRYNIPAEMRRYGVRLVIIDSIAAAVRGSDPNDVNPQTKAKDFYEIARSLKEAAYELNAAVICINQVTACLNQHDNLEVFVDSGPFNDLRNMGETNLVPTLGNAWTLSINMRVELRLIRSPFSALQYGDHELNSIPSESRRFLRIVFAPHLPNGSCEYRIVKEGLIGVASSDHLSA